MRVLHVGPIGSQASGVTEVVCNVACTLRSRGHTVGVLPTVSSERPIDWDITKNVVNRRPVRFSIPLSLRSEVKLIQELEDYDIVHVHGVFHPTNLLLLKALSRARKPFVLSLHGNVMPAALRHHAVRKALALRVWGRRLLEAASAIHVLGPEEARAVEQLRISNSNLREIPNGVGKWNASPRVVAEGRSSTVVRRMILYVGRLDVHHKGIDILLSAVRLHRAALEQAGVRVVLVGPANSKRDRALVTREIDEEIARVVEWVGPKYGEEKRRYLETCDVFIHTSRYEGMPVAVLEALSAGKPCLVTQGTNMERIVRESASGIVVPPNSASVGEALMEVSRLSEDELRAMGNAGRSVCLQELAWDSIGARYERMYLDALEG